LDVYFNRGELRFAVLLHVKVPVKFQPERLRIYVRMNLKPFYGAGIVPFFFVADALERRMRLVNRSARPLMLVREHPGYRQGGSEGWLIFQPALEVNRNSQRLSPRHLRLFHRSGRKIRAILKDQPAGGSVDTTGSRFSETRESQPDPTTHLVVGIRSTILANR
jgi:hypothetical protein